MNDSNQYYPNSQQDPYSGGQYGGSNSSPQQPAETVYGSYGTQEQPPYQPAPQQPGSQPYTAYSSPGYGQQSMYSGNPYMPAPQSGGSNGGFAIAGLVLGIVSLVLFWFVYLGIPVAIVGIIMSALGRRSVERRTMATVGLVLSIVAIALSLCIIGVLVYAIIRARGY
jgi:hypothetical protein